MKKIIRFFFQGLVYLAPLGITVYVVYIIYNVIDKKLEILINRFFEEPIPGLGGLAIIAMLLLLTFLGFIGQTIIARPFARIFNKALEKAPLLKVIYSSLRDLLSAFVGEKKKFDKPVLVKINTSSNLYKLGFLTQSDLSHLKIKDKVSVYFPHSYNFSGEMYIVPTEHVSPVDIPSSEAMKFIVSGGVTKI